MPWVSAAIMVGGSILGHVMGKGDRDRKADAADRQVAAMEEQNQIGRDQLDWSKEQYSDWENRFDPVYDEMMATMDDDLTPNYAAIAGDISSSFQSQRNQERRNLMRYGVRPQDGSFARADREYGIREAGAHVGARSQAREATRGLKYNRLSSVLGMGYGVQPQMISAVGNAAGSAQRGLGFNASQYGDISAQWDQSARDTSYGVSNMIGNMDWAGMWNSTKGWWNSRNQNQTGTQMTVGAYSDARLKENITKICEVDGINIYTWTWNDIAKSLGIDSANVGVIADEHIDSGFVRVGPLGYLQVDYNGLFAGA